MKRKAKLVLGGLALFFGAVVLTGCTASFCTVTDQAHMLYAFDYGITDYRAEGADTTAFAYVKTNANGDLDPDGNLTKIEFTNVKYKAYSGTDEEIRNSIYTYCSTYKSIDENATKNGIALPSVNFLTTLDAVVLGHAIENAYSDPAIKSSLELPENKADLTTDQIVRDYKDTEAKKGILDIYGYLKYEDSEHEVGKKVLWTNFATYVDEVKSVITNGADECPSTDYLNLYKSSLNSSINGYRSCLATQSGDYGAYGPRSTPVNIEAKAWTDWKGLLEFLFVWPIGAFVDVLTSGFLGGGVASGWAQLLSIMVVTVCVRGIMMIFTIKQTASSAKMNELQPEIQKIQAKYPNANTNQYDKQRMAAEMQKLYKKHKINPFMAIITMIVQFPIFICVWGALQGSAYLSSGTIWNLRLSDSIGTTMFNGANWASGAAETALGLFLLMAVAQAFAMLLPQFIQKRKAKAVAKLGKNPAQNQQANRMKWFTYIMLAMIIFMGFSLASGMGVYWFFGALFSIAQTLIMQLIASKKRQKEKYSGSKETVSAKKKGK